MRTPSDDASARILFALMLAFVAAALGTGVRDVIWPQLTGGERFGTLRGLAVEYGPGYLFLELFAHNLGLACVVPALGLAFAHFERGRADRRVIALVLFVAVALSLGLAYLYVTREPGFILPFSLTLLTIEACAVVGLAGSGWRAVNRLRPGRGLPGQLTPPMRELAPWFLGSSILLAVGAFAEVAFIAQVHG